MPADGLVAQIECNPLIRVTANRTLSEKLSTLLPPGAVTVLSAKRKPIPHRLNSTDPLLAMT